MTMKRIITLLTMASLTMTMTAQTTANDVLDVARRVNNYFMAKYSDPTLPTNVKKIRPSSLWTRAVYYEGSVKTYGSAVPTTFTVSDITSPYLFSIKEGSEAGQYVLTNGAGNNAGTFTIGNFVDCPSKGGAQTRNDDGTYTPAADITADMNLVYVYNGSQYWNGNNWNKVGDNCFATWANGHPYAVYEVEVVTTVDVTYILQEGGSEVTRTVVTQNANSAVAIPSTFGSTSMYDFNVDGTIGEEDCEVVVTRTVKAGIVTMYLLQNGNLDKVVKHCRASFRLKIFAVASDDGYLPAVLDIIFESIQKTGV